MTKEQYNEWRNHPATLFFRQFIKDRRDALILQGQEMWMNSPKEFPDHMQFMRGRLEEMFALEDMAFEDIEAFYREKNGSEDSET